MKATKIIAIEAVNRQFRDLIRRLPVRSVFPMIAAVAGFGLIGGALLFSGHAATSSVSVEPEQGNKASGATAIADSGASGGKAVLFGMATVTPLPPGPTPQPAPGPTPGTDPLLIPTGTAAQLATQILASPNVFFGTAQEKTDFQKITVSGTQVNTCGNVTPISPKLLGILAVALRTYKVQVLQLAAGYPCATGKIHMSGVAMDIGAISAASGTGSTGGNLNWPTLTAAQMTFATKFYNDFGQIISHNGGGYEGESLCLSGETKYPNVTYPVDDPCTHLHYDVR